MSEVNYKVFIGDCIETMREMADQSVHCCVTSPPYFGLRDYGVDGQIGLEETPEQFIAKLVEVFREVRRVLRDDGTLWVNIGDSYARSAGPEESKLATTHTIGVGYKRVAENGGAPKKKNRPPEGLKPKDLIGIPWMLAFALRADGWYLRQDIIWHKPNPMPESVKDRCTKAHEYVFLLSKSERYFFDSEAMKEPAICAGTRPSAAKGSFNAKGEPLPGQLPFRAVTETRNRRSVWSVATKPYKGAHFATFPPALIEPCILAGSPVGGTVLDPFGGSGTTAGVALKNKRNAVLCELNSDYAALVPERIKSINNNGDFFKC